MTLDTSADIDPTHDTLPPTIQAIVRNERQASKTGFKAEAEKRDDEILAFASVDDTLIVKGFKKDRLFIGTPIFFTVAFAAAAMGMSYWFGTKFDVLVTAMHEYLTDGLLMASAGIFLIVWHIALFTMLLAGFFFSFRALTDRFRTGYSYGFARDAERHARKAIALGSEAVYVRNADGHVVVIRLDAIGSTAVHSGGTVEIVSRAGTVIEDISGLSEVDKNRIAALIELHIPKVSEMIVKEAGHADRT